MKVDVNLLKGKIAERRKTQEIIADYVGIDRSTFYRKLKSDGLSFTVGEMHKMVEAIPLSDAEAVKIFLA